MYGLRFDDEITGGREPMVGPRWVHPSRGHLAASMEPHDLICNAYLRTKFGPLVLFHRFFVRFDDGPPQIIHRNNTDHLELLSNRMLCCVVLVRRLLKSGQKPPTTLIYIQYDAILNFFL